MVIYIEACESGSMLNKLPKDINIYATTASNPEESSYACYFDEKRQTYLGDLYSVNWMEDSDAEDITTESLFKQFQVTKKKTTESHVMEYGDLVRWRFLLITRRFSCWISCRLWVRLIMSVNSKV